MMANAQNGARYFEGSSVVWSLSYRYENFSSELTTTWYETADRRYGPKIRIWHDGELGEPRELFDERDYDHQDSLAASHLEDEDMVRWRHYHRRIADYPAAITEAIKDATSKFQNLEAKLLTLVHDVR